jgi:P-type Cu+ transporter
MLSALMARAVQFMRHPPRILPDSYGCISTRLAEGRLLSHIHQLLDRRITLIVYCIYPYQGGMGDLKCEKTGISMGTKMTRPHEHEAVVSQGETEDRAILALEGMTCASCAMRIEKGLKKLPGVKDASVNFATEQASVTYDPAQTGLEQLVQQVEAVGYTAFPQVSSTHTPLRGETSRSVSAPTGMPLVGMLQQDEQSRRKQADIRRTRNLLLLGIVLTLPVVILSMVFMNRFPGENLLLLVLTTPVWAVVGWEFHRGAIKTLRNASATMDTLISVGSTAAYVMSVVATFFPHVVGSVPSMTPRP